MIITYTNEELMSIKCGFENLSPSHPKVTGIYSIFNRLFKNLSISFSYHKNNEPYEKIIRNRRIMLSYSPTSLFTNVYYH